MTIQQTRDQIKQHADAVVRGDMAAVVADITEGLQQDQGGRAVIVHAEPVG